MKWQYLNVYRNKGYLLVRERNEQGVERQRKVYYVPSLWHKCKESQSTHKGFFGEHLKEISFENFGQMRKYVDMYKSEGDYLWGHSEPTTRFIYDEYGHDVESSMENVNIAYLDIEVLSKQEINGVMVDGGFPVAKEARFPISAITQYNSRQKKYVCFSLADWNKEESILSYKDDVIFIKCKSEEDLLKKWLFYWQKFYPNILTGWNVVQFDLEYIVNRLRIILGEGYVNKLSPWGIVNVKNGKNVYQKEIQYYDIVGVSTIDYRDAYKKFVYEPREKYTLDHIVKCELPSSVYKLKYEGSLNDLFYEKPVYFNDYNINDVHCVLELNRKRNLMEIVIFLSYYAGINFSEAFSPIKIWETLIYREQYKNGIIVPYLKQKSEKMPYDGAYVHPPVVGLKHMVCSFDLTSLECTSLCVVTRIE